MEGGRLDDGMRNSRKIHVPVGSFLGQRGGKKKSNIFCLFVFSLFTSLANQVKVHAKSCHCASSYKSSCFSDEAYGFGPNRIPE